MEPTELQEVYYEEVDGPLYEEVEVSMPTVTTSRKEKRYQCSMCRLMCCSPSTLRVHMRTHTGERPYQCPQCDYRAVAPYVLRGHMKVHIKTSDRRHGCHLCSYRTNYMASLRVHMRSHTGERPYSCTECEYSTAYRNALLLHMARHSEETKRFTCQHCCFSSTQKYALKLHTQSRHSTTRPFKCNLCSFATTTKTLLNAHAITHSTEKPFACLECDFKTHKKQCLTRHMIRHTGDKPFKCGVCGFRSAHRYTMKTHIARQHKDELPNGFSEDYIIDSSSQPEDATGNHNGTSTNPYPCFICNERSLTPKDWRDHLAEHSSKPAHQRRSCVTSGETPLPVQTSFNHNGPNWPCPLCESGFALRSYLVRHITNRHEFGCTEELNAFLNALRPANLVKEGILTNQQDKISEPSADEGNIKLEDVAEFIDSCQIIECVVQEDMNEYIMEDINGQSMTNQLTISETGEIVALQEEIGNQMVYDDLKENGIVSEECVIQYDGEGEFFNGDVQYVEVASDADGQVAYI